MKKKINVYGDNSKGIVVVYDHDMDGIVGFNLFILGQLNLVRRRKQIPIYVANKINRSNLFAEDVYFSGINVMNVQETVGVPDIVYCPMPIMEGNTENASQTISSKAMLEGAEGRFDVVFIDLSPDQTTANDLLAAGHSVTVFDHHAQTTKLRVTDDLMFLHVNTSLSATEIVYQEYKEFIGNNVMSEHVDYYRARIADLVYATGTYDCWRFLKEKLSTEDKSSIMIIEKMMVSLGNTMMVHNRNHVHDIAMKGFFSADLQPACEAASLLKKTFGIPVDDLYDHYDASRDEYQTELCKALVKARTERHHDWSNPHVGNIAFSFGYSNLYYDKLDHNDTGFDGYAFGVMVREGSNDDWIVSLRAIDEDCYFLAEIAMEQGGGGHPRACGFTVRIPGGFDIDAIKDAINETIQEFVDKGVDPWQIGRPERKEKLVAKQDNATTNSSYSDGEGKNI